ncbi:hypothetical protein P9112_003298 [Eukaryota sp. TZLM1-RC]
MTYDQFEVAVHDNRIDAQRPSMIKNVFSMREWDELCEELNERLSKRNWTFVPVTALGFILFFGFFVGFIGFEPIPWGLVIGFGSFFASGPLIALGMTMMQKSYDRAYKDSAAWIRRTINAAVESRGLFFKLEIGKKRTFLVIQLQHNPPSQQQQQQQQQYMPTHSVAPSQPAIHQPPQIQPPTMYSGKETVPDVFIP